MEAYYFTCANEDYKWVHFSLNLYRKNEMRVNKSYHLFLSHSLYTYDMRNLDVPVNVHMDHVSAVLDVDYSPTGREFVSASFDKNNPNLSKKQRPQQVSVVWKGQGERESERERERERDLQPW